MPITKKLRCIKNIDKGEATRQNIQAKIFIVRLYFLYGYISHYFNVAVQIKCLSLNIGKIQKYLMILFL